MSAIFTLEGTENLKRIFNEFPEEGFRKPVNAAFRKAAKPMGASMASNLPSSLAGLKKAIRIKTYKSELPLVAVGPFKKGVLYQNRKGQTWNPYMLFYWFNYGTLANRLSGHAFQKARRKTTASWKGGIKPGEFIERAINLSLPEAQKIFEEDVDKEITKFFEKLALK
jgi:hypothetical protein